MADLIVFTTACRTCNNDEHFAPSEEGEAKDIRPIRCFAPSKAAAARISEVEDLSAKQRDIIGFAFNGL